MRHTVYALFPGRATAMSALRELSRLDVETILHDGRLRSDRLDLMETDLMPRMLTGILIGLLLGPVLGLGMLSFAGLEVNAAALVLAALLGAAGCGLGGLLIGSGSPDHTLEKLASEAEGHEILLTLVGRSYSALEAAEAAVHRHGGVIARRGFVSRGTPEPHDDLQHLGAARSEQVWEDEGGHVLDDQRS